MSAVLTKKQTVSIGHGRGGLAAPAAASVRRIDAQLHRPLDVNEAWRSPVDADERYADYLAYLAGGPWAPIALPGDESVHCRGYAIDTDDHTPALVRLLNANGWFQTVYRDGKLVEPWHFEYDRARDTHRNDPEGDDLDMSKRIYKKFLPGQKIGKKFGPIYLNKGHDVSVAFGGTDVIGGALHVAIKTDKPSATAPAAYQVRAIVASTKNGKTTKIRSLGTHELIATTGATLAQVPVPPVDLGKGERLRFQIASVDGQTGTLTSAHYRGRHIE